MEVRKLPLVSRHNASNKRCHNLQAAWVIEKGRLVMEQWAMCVHTWIQRPDPGDEWRRLMMKTDVPAKLLEEIKSQLWEGMEVKVRLNERGDERKGKDTCVEAKLSVDQREWRG
jgi:hypothetical protein